jgi:1-deoxy-D-xylulose-5-phosphate reductoisomerase
MIVSERNIAILGSTGSIGRSTLDVVSASDGAFRVFAISAHRNLSLAVQQARRFRPQLLVATEPDLADDFDWSGLPPETELRIGADEITQVVARDEVDTVVAAIVGSAGLEGTWAGVTAGKRIALANKESLVMAGSLITRAAADRNVPILPVDSEHSAVFQALAAGRREDVRRIILTASGGPFRRHSKAELERVTVDEALAHPTWDMGRKITIDSATMMNKALEIIEARWLFDLPPDQIDVVVHPQSVVHSMVEYVDGSVVAQLSPPDMRLPIQYALTYPDRRPSPAPKLDLTQFFQLDFEPPDEERFPALPLGKEVAQRGGTAGAVMNAANEAAVSAFLDGQLGFSEIVPACRAVVEHHNFDPSPSLEQLFQIDRWARQEVTRWVCA